MDYYGAACIEELQWIHYKKKTDCTLDVLMIAWEEFLVIWSIRLVITCDLVISVMM